MDFWFLRPYSKRLLLCNSALAKFLIHLSSPKHGNCDTFLHRNCRHIPAVSPPWNCVLDGKYHTNLQRTFQRSPSFGSRFGNQPQNVPRILQNMQNCLFHPLVCSQRTVQFLSNSPPRLHPITRILQCFAGFYGVIPFGFVPFLVLLDFDPHYILYKLVVSALNYQEGPRTLVIIALLRLITIILTFEAARIFPFIIITGFFYTLRIISYSNNLSQFISQPADDILAFLRMNVVIKMYTQLAIILMVARPMFMGVTVLFLYSTFSLSLNCNFVSIKMHSVFPPQYYVMFPSMAGIASLIIHIGMPILVECGQSWDEVRRKLAATLVSPGLKMKWAQKRVRAMRGLEIPVGVRDLLLFRIEPGTRTTFNVIVLEYTINLLMSIQI